MGYGEAVDSAAVSFESGEERSAGGRVVVEADEEEVRRRCKGAVGDVLADGRGEFGGGEELSALAAFGEGCCPRGEGLCVVGYGKAAKVGGGFIAGSQTPGSLGEFGEGVG